jgi:hypothetical protein
LIVFVLLIEITCLYHTQYDGLESTGNGALKPKEANLAHSLEEVFSTLIIGCTQT